MAKVVKENVNNIKSVLHYSLCEGRWNVVLCRLRPFAWPDERKRIFSYMMGLTRQSRDANHSSEISCHVNFLKANLSLISTFHSFILWKMVFFSLYFNMTFIISLVCESLNLFGLELTKHKTQYSQHELRIFE